MDHYGDEDTRAVGWAFWLLLLVMLVAVAAAAVIVFTPGDNEPSTSPSRPGATATAEVTENTTGRGTATSNCPALKRSPAESPVVAPAVEWRTKGPFTYPISVSSDGESVSGPARPTFPGTDTCYAHTPLGATYAAASASAELLVAESAVPFIKQRVVGPQQPELLEQVSELGPGDFSFGDITFRVTAFKIIDYRPSRAIVETVTIGRNSTGVTSTKATTRELVWDGGDWKIKWGGNAGDTRTVGDPQAEGFLTW